MEVISILLVFYGNQTAEEQQFAKNFLSYVMLSYFLCIDDVMTCEYWLWKMLTLVMTNIAHWDMVMQNDVIIGSRLFGLLDT